MIKLVTVCKYDIRDRKRVKFHASGKYVPDNPEKAYMPWEEDTSYSRGNQYTKCGILQSRNPFGYGPENRTIEYHLILRQDHAERFATPCKKCFRTA